MSDNFNFLIQANLEKYEGEWIAVSGNKVIAKGESASKVLSLAERKTDEKVTIMRVPEKEQVCIF